MGRLRLLEAGPPPDASWSGTPRRQRSSWSIGRYSSKKAIASPSSAARAWNWIPRFEAALGHRPPGSSSTSPGRSWSATSRAYFEAVAYGDPALQTLRSRPYLELARDEPRPRDDRGRREDRVPRLSVPRGDAASVRADRSEEHT